MGETAQCYVENAAKIEGQCTTAGAQKSGHDEEISPQPLPINSTLGVVLIGI